ncbi:hypothetical protein FACS189490_13910 [Clostridia bacterium]|nr:hypothetical protein FACS189490_13910 [Clostridia bacterium]
MNHYTDGKFRAYRCSKNSNGCCEYANLIGIKKLEGIVAKTLEQIISSDDIYNYEHLTPRPKDANELIQLENALKRVRAKLERLQEAYLNGIDTIEEYRERKRKFQEDETALLAQIAEYSENSITMEKIDKLKSNIKDTLPLLLSDGYTLEQKSFAIRTIVDKIVVDKYIDEYVFFYCL